MNKDMEVSAKSTGVERQDVRYRKSKAVCLGAGRWNCP